MKNIIPLIILLLLWPSFNTPLAEVEEPFGYYSSIYLLPDYSRFADPEYLYIDIMADPDGKPANSASAVIDFPEDMLMVTDFSYNGDFCHYFGDQIIDGESGYINISCGNYSAIATSTVHMASITFKKLAAGNAKFDLSGSAIHAHDGYGTNFLGFSGIHNIYLMK